MASMSTPAFTAIASALFVILPAIGFWGKEVKTGTVRAESQIAETKKHTR